MTVQKLQRCEDYNFSHSRCTFWDPDSIETSSGKVACNADGTQKRSFNGNRHAADKALAAWVPQSINTLSRKAGELTPRVARATKKARAS